MSDARDELIRKVRCGELSPHDAEAEAAQLKLKPLAYRPEPDDYDPMKEAFWSLPMAVAWIAYRTPDAVREWWDAYRAKCCDWRFQEWRDGHDGPVHEGHFLEQRRAATLARLRMMDVLEAREAFPKNLSMSVAGAIDALWVALRGGCFDATGIDDDTNRRTPILVFDWHDLTWFEESGRDVIRSELKPDRNIARYTDVLVPMAGVRGLWPSEIPPAPTLPPTMDPRAAGYMPLYCAAQWIATCGGTVEINPRDVSVWQDVFAQLLEHIASERVAITGVRDGEREKLHGHMFAGMPVDYPFSDTPFNLLLSEELYLSSCVYIDEEHWRKGWNDSLQTRQGCKWSN